MANWTVATLLDRLLDELGQDLDVSKRELLLDPELHLGEMTAADVVAILKTRALLAQMS